MKMWVDGALWLVDEDKDGLRNALGEGIKGEKNGGR